MPKAATATTKGTLPTKKTSTSKPRVRATPVVDSPVVSPPAAEGETLTSILGRLDALEEKVARSFAELVEELRTFKVTLSTPPTSVGEGEPETDLPLVADVLRKNLMEHLTPVTAAIKRLEERVGFVANRLKHGGSGGGGGGGGGGQDRPKSWRHDQGRHQRPPRGQQNTQRPTPPQAQQWTPPSAASVQGHFAPRPLPGGGFVEEED